MAQRPSGHARVLNDFYPEPIDCTEALIAAFDRVAGGFHDPFVGSGSTIVAAARHDITATGADLVDRCGGRFPVRDFFTDTTCYSNRPTRPLFGQPRLLNTGSIICAMAGGSPSLPI